MARKNSDVFNEAEAAPEPVFCPLCERVIPGDEIDVHHLISKSKGGKKRLP